MQNTVGQMTPPTFGNITTLNATLFADQRLIESNLGYGVGRLAQGYEILLLKTLPPIDMFEFDGTTLRSGGREGAPTDDPVTDKFRTRVHDTILKDRGQAGYESLQQASLRSAQIVGGKRLVRIQPVTRHSDALIPSMQYPIGGAFLQWKIKCPGVRFLCAAIVDRAGVVTTPTERLNLNSGNYLKDLEARKQLRDYLMQA